jgi:hypothetical protein
MGDHRVLVVANETCAGRALIEELRGRVGPRSDVLVVAPALNSRLRHMFADTDGAYAAAEERLAESVEALRAVGIPAAGAVGDSDPVQAIEDALAEFEATEIVISTIRPSARTGSRSGLSSARRSGSRSPSRMSWWTSSRARRSARHVSDRTAAPAVTPPGRSAMPEARSGGARPRRARR